MEILYPVTNCKNEKDEQKNALLLKKEISTTQ